MVVLDGDISNISAMNLEEAKVVTGKILPNSTIQVNIFNDLIVDEQFIKDIESMTIEPSKPKDLLSIIYAIQTNILEYFNKIDDNQSESREDVYTSNLVIDEDGQIKGTMLSSLKGKGVAQCIEKAIVAYMCFKQLIDSYMKNWNVEMIISLMSTEDSTEQVKHAFIILKNKEKNYPSRYILYDPENYSLIHDNEKNEDRYTLGIYSLTDDDMEAIENNVACSPKSFFEVASNGRLEEIASKRIYGQKSKVNVV